LYTGARVTARSVHRNDPSNLFWIVAAHAVKAEQAANNKPPVAQTEAEASGHAGRKGPTKKLLAEL